TQEGIDILYSGGRYARYLTLARAGVLPFLALLLLATWLWARRLFASQGTALLSVLLLASVPAVLGHAALATLDVAAAATCLLALYALQLWVVSARLRDAALFGLAAGLAVGTKFSAVPFIGLALPALALVRAGVGWRDPPGVPPAADTLRAHTPAARARSLLPGLALALLAALLPIALAYGPRSPNPAAVAARFNWAVSYLLQERGLDHELGVLLTHLWLPRALRDLANGIVALKAHNDSGHLSYLLGHVRLMGWWYFYLVALAVKTPIPLLAAGTAGLAWLARDGWRSRNGWALAPAVLVGLMLTFASAFSRINIGIRHLLVLYPFFALGAAYVTARAWRALAAWRNRPLAVAPVAVLRSWAWWRAGRRAAGWRSLRSRARAIPPATPGWMPTSRWSASASRSICTTFPDGPGASGRAHIRGTQARDPHQRRWMGIVERRVYRIRCQSAGVVPMQLDERRGELGRAGMAGGECVCLKLMPARP
ncbi:MAG: hypothetical protein E6K44_12895, partial [Gammaproteobacteria bacterium]